MSQSLKQIAQRTGTDKFDHKYCDFYESLFSKLKYEPIKLLEIGILDGKSLEMWKEYFPNAIVYGADIINKKHYAKDRILIEECDQENPEQLKNLFKDEIFDIIVDDGGHTMKQQQITFINLFPRLKTKGMYILEDLHTSYAHYEQESKEWFYNTSNCKTTMDLLINMHGNLTVLEKNKFRLGFAVSESEIVDVYKSIDSINIFFAKHSSYTSCITKK